MSKRHKVGDTIWRGFARRWDLDGAWMPEIRPGQIRAVDADGYVDVVMSGAMPGMEGKRNPGAWVATGQPPERYSRTPEAALRIAKLAVDEAQALAYDSAA